MRKRTHLYIPGGGYLNTKEREFVLHEVRKLQPLIACGLVSHGDAREMILRRLSEFRAAQKFMRASRKKARGS